MEDLKQLDLYALLEVSSTATLKQIKTAYRKKALKCHPDKNPDNPQAVKLFHQLKKALELLSDEAARVSYDKVLKAREANKARNDALNYQRKKLKLDLEEKEKRAFEKQSAEDFEKQRLDHLKKETFKQMRAEVERVCKEKADEANEKLCSLRRITIRWKADKDDASNGGYNKEILTKLFSKYGNIEAIVISKKKNGRALLEFSSSDAARRAKILEVGYESNPLTVTVVGGDIDEFRASVNIPNSKKSDSNRTPLFPSYFSTTTSENSNKNQSSSYDDLKSMVFQKMREAQAKKESTEMQKKFAETSNCEISS